MPPLFGFNLGNIVGGVHCSRSLLRGIGSTPPGYGVNAMEYILTIISVLEDGLHISTTYQSMFEREVNSFADMNFDI